MDLHGPLPAPHPLFMSGPTVHCWQAWNLNLPMIIFNSLPLSCALTPLEMHMCNLIWNFLIMRSILYWFCREFLLFLFFLKVYFIITASVVYFTKEFASDSDFLKSLWSKQKYLLSFASGNAVFSARVAWFLIWVSLVPELKDLDATGALKCTIPTLDLQKWRTCRHWQL